MFLSIKSPSEITSESDKYNVVLGDFGLSISLIEENASEEEEEHTSLKHNNGNSNQHTTGVSISF